MQCSCPHQTESITQSILTVVVGNVVGDVNFPIRPLIPQAAPGGAWVSIFVVCPQSNVSFSQGGLISVRVYVIFRQKH